MKKAIFSSKYHKKCTIFTKKSRKNQKFWLLVTLNETSHLCMNNTGSILVGQWITQETKECFLIKLQDFNIENLLLKIMKKDFEKGFWGDVKCKIIGKSWKQSLHNQSHLSTYNFINLKASASLQNIETAGSPRWRNEKQHNVHHDVWNYLAKYMSWQ